MRVAPPLRGAKTDSTEGRTHKRAALRLSVAALAGACSLVSPGIALASSNLVSAHQAASYNITTKFAVAQAAMPIYRQPNTHSGVVNKLVYYTPDGEALQTYEFVASKRVNGTTWQEIDVPMRPNGQVGWVKSSWLDTPQVSHKLIIVDIATETLTVYDHGKVVFTAPVGTGDSSVGWGTPIGHFWVAEAFPSRNPFYGPWAFGTTDRASDTEFPDGSIVGIHGTDQPQLIPGDPSHGCIRLKDEDILKLKALVSIGDPVWIQ
jgi:lipoprotein-anchoring transpeptidase ErfK/SrfK